MRIFISSAVGLLTAAAIACGGPSTAVAAADSPIWQSISGRSAGRRIMARDVYRNPAWRRLLFLTSSRACRWLRLYRGAAGIRGFWRRHIGAEGHDLWGGDTRSISIKRIFGERWEKI